MLLRRPHVGAYDALNFARVPSSYCRSPSGSTTFGAAFWIAAATAPMWQEFAGPAPPVEEERLGSEAMSPAAATTGSAARAGPVRTSSAATAARTGRRAIAP